MNSTQQEDASGRVSQEETQPSQGRERAPLVRDVYKCGFLRHKTLKNPANLKNGDAFWVVFCVVDELEPFIEMYAQKQRPTKRGTPAYSYSLKNCIHISPAIVIDETENNFEFAITLDSQVVRLIASTRQLMDDWIDTIRSRLRQLKILSPKENYYSKDPSSGWKQISSISSVRPLPPIPIQSYRSSTISVLSRALPSDANGSHNLPPPNFPNTTNGSLYEPIFAGNAGRETPRETLTAGQRTLSSDRFPFLEPMDRESSSRGSLAMQQLHPLSLRESQVLKLQKEILHKDGVRIILRKKDCHESIALVDCFGTVFVAGWKQKQYPQLHNTFHIGDAIISVCGQKIQSASEAYRLMRQPPLIVEIVLQRVPFGKVFVIKRDYDSQDLGFIREGNTAEIIDVHADGLAAKHGLAPKAAAVDSSLGPECNWFITEINNRPLNLFFKSSEVKDRLNAVGKDISILVQPSDVIKVLKKQLKAFKGYKDYIVQ